MGSWRSSDVCRFPSPGGSARPPAMTPVLEISGLGKTYKSGHKALSDVDLSINKGEIFALLGPNGAGKTTLISIVCGIVTASAGTVTVGGHDHAQGYRAARTMIGLVPQELHTDAFETVMATVSFSRGLFGKPRNPGFIEQLLRDLSLWDKRDSKIMELSGGMKRRVMIAKALSHEPEILFLDEPTAGVDVELRHDMWNMVRGLRERGVTIILTTHYIEEVEGKLLDGAEDHAHIPEGQTWGRAAGALLISMASLKWGLRLCLPGREAVGLGRARVCS